MSKSAEHAPPTARDAGGFTGGVAALAEGRLYGLQNPFALDGRVNSYPGSARGYSVANSYLLTQSDAALLIDTGFGKDEPVIRAQIKSLIVPGLPLSMFPLRLNEFMSINNVEAFAGHFNVEQCYTSNVDAALWFDFGAKADGRSILESMRVTARICHCGHDRGGKEGSADRGHAGADPPDRHALAVRRRDAHTVQLRPVHARVARLPRMGRGSLSTRTTPPPGASCAHSCSTRATGGWKARRRT